MARPAARSQSQGCCMAPPIFTRLPSLTHTSLPFRPLGRGAIPPAPAHTLSRPGEGGGAKSLHLAGAGFDGFSLSAMHCRVLNNGPYF